MRSIISVLFKRVIWCTNLALLAFGERCQTRGRVFWKSSSRHRTHLQLFSCYRNSRHFYFQNKQTTESKWDGYGSLLLLDCCLIIIIILLLLLLLLLLLTDVFVWSLNNNGYNKNEPTIVLPSGLHTNPKPKTNPNPKLRVIFTVIVIV